MGKHLPRMKSFKPRKKRKLLPKDTLLDLHRKVSHDVHNYILSLEQKEIPKIHYLQGQLKSDLQKHKLPMEQIALTIGARTALAVRDFLSSVDLLVGIRPEFVDPATIHHCYTSDIQLKKILQAA